MIEPSGTRPEGDARDPDANPAATTSSALSSAEPHAVAAGHRSLPRFPQRILVVDDDPSMLDLYCRVLTNGDPDRRAPRARPDAPGARHKAADGRHEKAPLKFVVDTASDGETAFELVSEAAVNRAAYIMAFLDVRLPGGWDGVETARRLWQVDPDLQIVFCAPHKDYTWAQMVERAGRADRFVVLCAPFHPAEVRQLAVAFSKRVRLRGEEQRRAAMLMRNLSDESPTVLYALDASARRTQSMLEGAREALLIVDRAGTLTHISGAAADLLGIRGGDATGANVRRALPETGIADVCDAAFAAGAGTAALELPGMPGHWVELVAQRCGAEAIVFLRDTGAAHATAAAGHDALTGLPDRVSAMRRLGAALAQARHDGGTLAVILLDVDRFREITELVGYAGADEVLAQLGRRVASFSAEGHYVGHAGGAEFVGILSDAAAANPMPVAGSWLRALTEPLQAAGEWFHLSASVGIAQFPRDGIDESELLRKAAAAMAEAKATGGGAVRLYDSDLTSSRHAKVRLRHEMDQALAGDEFELFYQPQVCLREGRARGAEALLRWRHASWGLLAPADFIAIAEESPLIARIDAWVVDRACRQLAAWQRDGTVASDFVVALNLSLRQLTDSDLVDRIAAAIDRYGLDARHLEIEVTEATMIRHYEAATHALSALKALGAHVALDHFGAEKSNLDYVRHIPLDTLKIDRSLIRGMGHDAQAMLRVDAIVKLARALSLRVVAEGIESGKQRDFLADIGCDAAQGYLISRPLAANAFARFIRAG